MAGSPLRLLRSCLLVLSLTATTTLCSGVFELKIDSFTSTRFSNSGLCAGGLDERSRAHCHIFFRVCVKHAHAQDVIGPEPPCTYGTAQTDIHTADRASISASPPVRVPFHFKWPGTFSLIIEAWNAESSGVDSTENQNNLLSRVAMRRSLTVGSDWSQDVSYEGQWDSSVGLSYRVVCGDHYHGNDCSAYCRPRNDTFGHYSCDSEGQRVCVHGWTGEYCAEPICASGCSVDHGTCERPGECVCRQGWQGAHCDECARHPGCVHGTCQLPWQCNCKEGWGGLYCDQDLNYCTNHKPCQNGAACTNTGQGSYTCTCKPGFSGKNCEIDTNECDSNPCKNGGSCTDSVNAFSCACPSGFYGAQCEVVAMTCADEPCFNEGTCVEEENDNKMMNGGGEKGEERGGEGRGGYRCVCPSGYTGSNCEKRLDKCSSNPCANGAQCLDVGNRVVCRCRTGFTGKFCQTNTDECASNPCKNSGTCTDGMDDFHCSCTLGFTGKDCSVRATQCDNYPCENGGTCFTHFTGPVCQCVTGYMGARCEYSLLLLPQNKVSTLNPVKNEEDNNNKNGDKDNNDGNSNSNSDSNSNAALIAAVVFGLVTLVLLVLAAVHVLRQLGVRKKLLAMTTSVKNDLEASVNNKNAIIGGGGMGHIINNNHHHNQNQNQNKNGLSFLPGEKDAFLSLGLSQSQKVSNKEVEKSGGGVGGGVGGGREAGDENENMLAAVFKNKMADRNLDNEEKDKQLMMRRQKNSKFDLRKNPSIVLPPPCFQNQSVYIIPEHSDQCVFATEV